MHFDLNLLACIQILEMLHPTLKGGNISFPNLSHIRFSTSICLLEAL
jgi:hypothetical protein